MKKLYYFLIVFVLLFSCNNDKEKLDSHIVLSGQIKEAPDNNFVLKNVFYQKVGEIQTDSTGHFTDTLDLKAGYYQFGNGKQYAWLYLKPGNVLNINLNYKDFDKSLSYKGKDAPVNTYLAQSILKGIALKPKTSYNYYGKLDEKAFVALFDSIENVYLKMLQQVPDNSFINLEKKKLLLNKLYYYLQYPLVRRYLTKDDSFKVSKAFFTTLQNIDINDPDYSKLPGFTRFVEAYLQDMISKKQGKAEYDPLEMMQAVKQNIKDKNVQEQLAYQNAKYNLLYTKNLNAFYQLFNIMVKDSIYKKEISTKYKAIQDMERGNPSPDFTAFDIKGKEYHLKDFAGKPLYIDLWATWCGPCVGEIPALEKIKTAYKDKPITFLSIDVYDNKEKWQEFVQKRQLSGWQLISTDREMDFLKKYVVDGIPRFILIDKNGKIIDANAPRPSNPKLIELIDKSLENDKN